MMAIGNDDGVMQRERDREMINGNHIITLLIAKASIIDRMSIGFMYYLSFEMIAM